MSHDYGEYYYSERLAAEREELKELRAWKEQKEEQLSICEGRYVGEMDGKPVPGDFFDGTDGCCPGWWRGQDDGVRGAVERIQKVLDGKDSGAGVLGDKKLERARERVLELVRWREGKKGVEEYFAVKYELGQANLKIQELEVEIGNLHCDADRASKWEQE